MGVKLKIDPIGHEYLLLLGDEIYLPSFPQSLFGFRREPAKAHEEHVAPTEQAAVRLTKAYAGITWHDAQI
jgi:hypothetical protein